MQVFQDKVDVTVNLELKKTAEHSTGVNLPAAGLTPNLVETTTESSENGREGPRVNQNDPNEADDARGRSRAGSRHKTSNKTEKKQIDKALYGVKTVAQLAPIVEKITVAVVISEEVMAGLADDAEKEKKKADIEAIVKQAVGFTKDRDEIECRVFKFVDPPPAAETAGVDLMAMVQTFGPALGQVLAVILVILFLRGMLKKAQVKRVDAAAGQSTAEEPENLAPEEVARRMRREIEKAINEDPAAISRMLDNWLTEQKA
jgi:flagellar biosynthesis/type III secretory pathway M-ring protein FliF/YscJ